MGVMPCRAIEPALPVTVLVIPAEMTGMMSHRPSLFITGGTIVVLGVTAFKRQCGQQHGRNLSCSHGALVLLSVFS